MRRVFVLVAAALLVGGSNGAARPLRSHDSGTMMILTPGVLTTDPALAWYSPAGMAIGSATGLQLMNYAFQGTRVVAIPEASTAPRVSRDRRTWIFNVKPDFRFSDGAGIGAVNFQAAINRNFQLAGRGAFMLGDIVGAGKAIRHKTKTAGGITVKGNRLTIKLVKPSGNLDIRLAMPFFAAIPLTLPSQPPFASGGPYYAKSGDFNHVVLEKNPYYRGRRPFHFTSFDILRSTDEAKNIAQVEAGTADYVLGGVSEQSAETLAAKYSVNGTSQLQVHPTLSFDYIALNTSHGPFTSLALRKAANYAIDRRALLRARGAFTGTRTDQILPPGMPGFKDVSIYPLNGSDFKTARKLADKKCGNVKLATSDANAPLAQLFGSDLAKIGCRVNIKTFKEDFQIFLAAGKGQRFDAAFLSWNQDYPDPYDFLDILLDPNDLQRTTNENLSYFNSPDLNKAMDRANKSVGSARYAAYGKLDIAITSKAAPWVIYDNRNVREFIAPRIGGYRFQPANGAADLNTFSVK